MTQTLESTDVKNKLEDLSGLVIKPGENPYQALINVCDSRPVSHSVTCRLGWRPPKERWKLRAFDTLPCFQCH